MKQLATFFALLTTFFVASSAHAQPPPRNPATTAATLDWLRQRLDVREITARPGNDGPAVAALIRAGGGEPGEHPEWCGFTQTADQRAHGLPYPGGGMQGAARYWFVDAARRPLPRTQYLAGQRGTLDSIQPGDLVGMAWAGSGGVIHHITRCAELVPALRKGRPPRGFWCLAGNEGHYPNAGLHHTYYNAMGALAAAARWDYR